MQYALKSLVANPAYTIGPFNSRKEANDYLKERMIGPFEVVFMFPPRKEIGEAYAQEG